MAVASASKKVPDMLLTTVRQPRPGQPKRKNPYPLHFNQLNKALVLEAVEKLGPDYRSKNDRVQCAAQVLPDFPNVSAMPAASTEATEAPSTSAPVQASLEKNANKMCKNIVGELLSEVCGPGKFLSDSDSQTESESDNPVPDDYANLRHEVECNSESTARQLYARLAFYDLDIVHLHGGKDGDCLFDAILASVEHPQNVTPQHLRLEVVWFLVGPSRTTMVKALEQLLVARDISYYTLCKRLLKPGEWGGLETLLFVRWKWRLTLTVINPGHDQFIHHDYTVLQSQMILAYNGSTHYMPTVRRRFELDIEIFNTDEVSSIRVQTDAAAPMSVVPQQLIDSHSSTYEAVYYKNTRTISCQTIPCLLPQTGHTPPVPPPPPPPAPPPGPPPGKKATGQQSTAERQVSFYCTEPGCKKHYSKRFCLIRHMDVHKGIRYTCDVCKKSFSLKRSLADHIKTHTGGAGFICQVCGKVLSTKISLQSHLDKHVGDKPFKCSTCPKDYTSKSALVRHTSTCGLSSEQSHIYACPQCPLKLKTKDALKYHTKNIHQNPLSYVCQRCGKKMNSRGGLARHNCNPGG